MSAANAVYIRASLKVSLIVQVNGQPNFAAPDNVNSLEFGCRVQAWGHKEQ
jgi:hypothetical protein